MDDVVKMWNFGGKSLEVACMTAGNPGSRIAHFRRHTAETSESRIAHYRKQAAKARSEAAKIADDTSRALMIEVADAWDRLAELEVPWPPAH